MISFLNYFFLSMSFFYHFQLFYCLLLLRFFIHDLNVLFYCFYMFLHQRLSRETYLTAFGSRMRYRFFKFEIYYFSV